MDSAPLNSGLTRKIHRWKKKKVKTLKTYDQLYLKNVTHQSVVYVSKYKRITYSVWVAKFCVPYNSKSNVCYFFFALFKSRKNLPSRQIVTVKQTKVPSLKWPYKVGCSYLAVHSELSKNIANNAMFYWCIFTNIASKLVRAKKSFILLRSLNLENV